MANVALFDVTPPEITVTAVGPASVISPAATEAVNCVAPTRVVGSGEPFQSTTAPEANPLPFTVSVKAGPPAIALAGTSELITGGALMVKVALFVTPLESLTITVAVPGAAIRYAGTEAVTCVGPRKVVDSGEPFQSATASEVNPVPLSVNVKLAAPAVALAGLARSRWAVQLPARSVRSY